MKAKNKDIPIRCEAVEQGEKIKLYMYGTIEDDNEETDFDNNAITPNKVRNIVSQVGNKDIDLHLSSGGGSVYGSVAIHNYLKTIKNKVTVYIDSIAFSGASIIAMAGDEVVMFANSMMMIHQASLGFYGNSDEFIETAKVLEKFDEVVFNSYLKRFKGSETELKALIKAETYLSSKDCKANGLCDRIEEDETKDFESLEEIENKTRKVFNQSKTILAEEGDEVEEETDVLKELQTEVETLKSEVTKLKSDVAKLKVEEPEEETEEVDNAEEENVTEEETEDDAEELTDVEQIKVDIEKLKSDVEKLQKDVAELTVEEDEQEEPEEDAQNVQNLFNKFQKKEDIPTNLLNRFKKK